MTKERNLPPRDDRRKEAATSMECRALEKVLPVVVTRRTATIPQLTSLF